MEMHATVWESGVRNRKNVLVKVDAAVGKLAEGSSLLELGSLLGVLKHNNRQYHVYASSQIAVSPSTAIIVGGVEKGNVEDGEMRNIRIRQP